MRGRAVVLAAVLAAGTGGWVPVSANAAPCGSVQQAAGRWTAVDPPSVPSVPLPNSATAILSTTIVGQDPSVLLATDGISVSRSTDSGCHWKTTYTVGPADYWSDSGYADAYAVTNIASAHSTAPANRQVVYLALSPTPLELATTDAAALPELFAVSHDGGQTFAPVAPSPTAANPIVPECQTPPNLAAVPATDPRTIYLRCFGGVAHDQAAIATSGGNGYLYRSRDGGLTWSLVALPIVESGYGEWFQLGREPGEIWIAEQGTLPGSDALYLLLWHTTDDGAHWKPITPIGKPGVGIGQVGVAVDLTPGGAERIVAYAQIGAYLSTDGGKHWAKLRGLQSGTALLAPVYAVFLRHNLHLIAQGSARPCDSHPVAVRYTNPRGEPTTAAFPSRWGAFNSWGDQGADVTVGGAQVAFGVAAFCTPGTTTSAPPKLLTLRSS